ncbi:MAG: tRNA dihydrouridine(20/20a) synthase DusA [Pseudomonadales bacterium]
MHHPSRFSVAPMMDLTDRHARYLLRLISKRALLYTEMITVDALLHGDRDRLLAYNATEHPLALQLGGSDPVKLAECCKIAEQAGFDEVNLNVGCPSDRVQSGQIGACLMLVPDTVARCFGAMQEACNIPVTVKCRLGVDQQETHDTLPNFIETVHNAGCASFSVHARKAWLKGLSPKQNRDVPPLDYELVYDIKRQFSNLQIIINGGIDSIAATCEHLQQVDGVMMGRKAYYEPYTLHDVDHAVFGEPAAAPTREEIFSEYLLYVEQRLAEGVALKHMSKHVLGLFHGVQGARAFRRHISENAYQSDAGIDVLHNAAAKLLS